MYKRDLVSILSFYSISPVHAGSGMATGAVDLPIQRERHTNWPHIQASAVKGSIRAHFRDYSDEDKKKSINQIFGSDSQDKYPGNDDSIPGAISVSDAKLLAFPVRSNIAPFVSVISPAILKRLNNDLKMAGFSDILKIPELNDENSAVALNKFNTGDENKEKKIVLEDAVVNIENNTEIKFISEKFKDVENLLLVSDSMFDFIVSTCTEIQTQIRINNETGTTQDGSLRYEELLPSDTAMYSVVHYSRQHFENEIQAEMIKGFIQDSIKDFIQIGGDETLGRGICMISWLEKGGVK